MTIGQLHDWAGDAVERICQPCRGILLDPTYSVPTLPLDAWEAGMGKRWEQRGLDEGCPLCGSTVKGEAGSFRSCQK